MKEVIKFELAPIGCSLSTIIECLEKQARLHFQGKWNNVGLQSMMLVLILHLLLAIIYSLHLLSIMAIVQKMVVEYKILSNIAK